MTPLLDMRTVLIGDVLAYVLCSVVLATLWMRNRERSPGIGLWLVSFVMQFAALLLIAARGIVPDVVSMVVSNTLSIAGTIILLIGLELYLGKRGPHVQDWATLAAFALVQTYFAVVEPSLFARNINVALGLLFVTAESAWLLLRRVEPEVRPATRAAGLVFVGYVLLSVFRIVLQFNEPRVNDLFQSGVLDTSVLMAYQLLAVGLTFALLLLVNSRLFESLSRSEQKFSIAFTNIPDAVVLSSIADGRIIEVNQAFYEMAGLTRDQVSGTTSIALGIWADTADRDRFVGQLREHGRVVDFETGFRRSTGEVFPGSAFGDVLEIGGERCALTVVHDLTKRKRAEAEILRLNAELEERVQSRTEELEAANEELVSAISSLTEANIDLEEATHAKNDFLAAMSHELRTPLNSIIGFSGVLAQGLSGPLGDEQRKQVAMINNSGRHLLELINGVLDLAKIESGHDDPTIRDADLVPIAREMYETIRPVAEAGGVEMRWECSRESLAVRTDELRVGQILLNLLGNAVKFTQRGLITVIVSGDDTGPTVAVKDSGSGIALDDLERVFDDFYQVVPPGGGKTEGTGLGLAVSRRLAESIGARIDVASEPGKGSVFTLSLPGRSS
ncbi:MAG: ATP-binding protein [Coriobacteriia bacterium]|nr:ATP-binding protein [Coriobacteriia bacterium]